jgi:hypothetical protein
MWLRVQGLGAEHVGSKLVADTSQMHGLGPVITCSKLEFLVSKAEIIALWKGAAIRID